MLAFLRGLRLTLLWWLQRSQLSVGGFRLSSGKRARRKKNARKK